MSRLNGMTDQNHTRRINATYDAGNRLLSLNYPIGGEARQYNPLGQLTQINWTGTPTSTTITPPRNQQGKISSTTSSSGETVTYAYDSLNRLLSASGSGWAETYGYDGFGNLLSKTPTAGTPPSLSQAVNPANNQIVGQSYDSNGNQVTAPGFFGSATFDVENRIVAAPGIQYAYDSQNKRVWSGTVDSSNNLNLQSVYFYGINGKRIGTYSLNISYGAGQYTEIADPPADLITYFGSKRLDILEDRLGSNFRTALYPWGEDRTGQPNDQTKFATYTRDSATLLDYANNRYYSNAYGRFMTDDPSANSWDPANPQSWNTYAYMAGDPINGNDPSGLGVVTLPPVVPGTNCSTAFIDYAAQFGETIQQLFDSGTGILGIMSFFEQQGSGSTSDQNVWGALDWTFLNQWGLSASNKAWFYGPKQHSYKLRRNCDIW